MEQKLPEDRRKYLRLDVATKVNFRRQGGKETGAFTASSASNGKNISMDGLCFRTQQQLEVGTRLALEVFLPSQPEPLLLQGEVRWCRPAEAKEKDKTVFDTGIRLLNIKDSDENRYLRYVNERMMERLSRYLHL